jgi:hypothetical protein
MEISSRFFGANTATGNARPTLLRLRLGNVDAIQAASESPDGRYSVPTGGFPTVEPEPASIGSDLWAQSL